MHKTTTILLASLGALLSLSCGKAPAETPAPTATQRQALSSIGSDCRTDAECASGLCWDTSDSYPIYNPSWEQGYVCTVECDPDADGDTYCRNLAAQYNAPRPNDARCLYARAVYDNGPDESYYVCDLVAAGLGSYWSE